MPGRHSLCRSDAPGETDRRALALARVVAQIQSDPLQTRPGARLQAIKGGKAWLCHHGAVLTADRWSNEVPLPSFGPRMVCSCCGIVGADVRPDWQERSQRESLTGAQWR